VQSLAEMARFFIYNVLIDTSSSVLKLSRI